MNPGPLSEPTMSHIYAVLANLAELSLFAAGAVLLILAAVKLL